MIRRPPRSTLFPTRRSSDLRIRSRDAPPAAPRLPRVLEGSDELLLDRKSTRLNSSHTVISYAVFCLKKKKISTYACDESSNALTPTDILKLRTSCADSVTPG